MSRLSIDTGPPAADVTEREGEAPQLPERAVDNGDGTITLTLIKPVSLTIKGADGKTREERYEALVFHELVGADMRKIMQAPEQRRVDAMLAAALRMPQVTAGALFDRMGRRDIEAATSVATFL